MLFYMYMYMYCVCLMGLIVDLLPLWRDLKKNVYLSIYARIILYWLLMHWLLYSRAGELERPRVLVQV